MNMMFCKLMFLLIFKNCASHKKTIPVLMIDNDSVMSHIKIESKPFEIMSPKYFSELILDVLKQTNYVLIFVEETLCTEDVSSKDILGTPFYYLQKGIPENKVLYMPAVSEPYDILRQVFEPQFSNLFHLGPGEKLTILNKHKYAYVYFQDDSEMSRVEKLRKHDILMKEVYTAVRQVKPGPVMAFYTGKKNPIKLEQLVYPAHPDLEPLKERGVMVVTPDALFRLTGMFSSVHHRRSAFDDTPVVEYEMRTRRTLSTTMLVTDFHLQFNFEFDHDNWALVNVALLEAGEEVGRSETDIVAPWYRSYYCSEPISIINLRDGSSITLSEYQIEPRVDKKLRSSINQKSGPPIVRLKQDDPPTTAAATPSKPGHCYFSKAINCGPYFNTPILSGLIIGFMFVTIAFSGIIMMMNCGGNDRYDDPNQKPLIVAQEGGGGGI